MSFIIDADALVAVADALKLTGTAEMPAYWNRIVPRANAWAYGQIKQALVRRGHSTDDIDRWDEGPAYQMDLMLWRALTEGGALEGFDERWVQMLDRREELKEVILIVGEEWEQPEDLAGQSRTGPYDTSGDQFVADWRDPNYTQW
jgi:hypothetical protein